MGTTAECPDSCDYYDTSTRQSYTHKSKNRSRLIDWLDDEPKKKIEYIIYAPKKEREIVIALGHGEGLLLPHAFISLAKEIEFSKKILFLKTGWDGDNSIPINYEVWLAAIILLVNYTVYISDNYFTVIDTPTINPCKNGSIDLSWRTKQARALMNIRKSDDGILAYFYGDHYNPKIPNRVVVPVDTIESHLADWMKNLV